MTAEAGTRSWYVDDFADEWLPCKATLDGWAAYLGGTGVPEGNKPEHFDDDELREFAQRFPHKDGESFDASAILWSADIVARRIEGKWSLSRPIEPGEDFFAVRHAPGLGWDPDYIIYLSGEDEADPSKTAVGLCTELAQMLEDDDDDEQHIAVGRNEYHWKITFHAGPPPICTAHRSN